MDLSEVTQFEAKADTRTISQLIRDGAKLRPQAFFAYKCIVPMPGGAVLCDENGRVIYGSCALGAAYEAKYGELPDNNTTPFTTICERLDLTRRVAERIMVLNDECRMSREGIAKVLEKK